MRWFILPVVFLPAILAAIPSFAGGDIVFTARYYNPPGHAKSTSRFHLYRINPDGTGRRQITVGAFHDTEPQWSPDGRWIAFWRTKTEPPADPASDTWRLCVVPAAGGNIRILRASLKADWPMFDWSADGRNLLLRYRTGTDPHARDMIERVDIQTGHRTPGDQRMLEEIAPKARSSTGYETDFAASPRSPSLVITQASGTVERIPLRFGKGAEDLAQSGFGEPEPTPDSRFVLVSNTDGNSTNGHWKDYYRVDTQTGLITPYTQGKFLKWSPDGKRFVTLTGRDLADYERKRDGTLRRVWVSPLYVGVTATGKRTSIVQGLVYVTGADWRPKP